MTTDEAEMTLSQFLDRAIMGNLTQVTVIHGKGTGGGAEGRAHLSETVQRGGLLPPGPVRRGGDGVTIVALK